MKDLKGTKTEANLHGSCGESMARTSILISQA